ncbi:MAG TPA: DUF5655 domain-containing protein [Pyrinomonadaceae bacterium]|nr:DUF5655 domain-containing protein [Pyrinomonadaceae bacterium]
MNGSKTLDAHFSNRSPEVKAIYEAILQAARKFGPIKEEVKKTSIHLVRRTAFAGIGTRKTYLILTLKSDSDSHSPRVYRREQASANRWHLEIKLESPLNVDRDVRSWLKKAYDLSA